MIRLIVAVWLLLVVCCWGLPQISTVRRMAPRPARPYTRRWGLVAAPGRYLVALRVEVVVARW